MLVDWGFLKDPELREIVKKALNHVKKLRQQGKGWEDFELIEIGVPWWKFRKLIYDYDIFEVTLKSRSHTFYKFKVPIDEVEKRLNEFELVDETVVPTLPEERKVEEIPKDFWETVEGYEDLKDFFIASLKADNPCHILLVGGPATGKSVMLMEVERLSGSVFITGGTATKVGIRDVLMNYKPRILIIDELDKISNPDDISVLLTLMESGRVVVAKHKEYREEKMKTWVFAACNTTRGLPPELLDRFQVFYLKPYDRETLMRVIRKTLIKREGVNEELATYIARLVSENNGTVREAVRLSRIAKTKEEVDRYYSIIRKYKTI